VELSEPSTERTARPRRRLQLLIALGVAIVLIGGSLLVERAESKTNKVALAQTPKLVSVIEPRQTHYSATRLYVGTIEPWIEAKIGPQLVSAYVDTVLVRPGARVAKGAVLATLDCRNANAASQAVAMTARALEARQQAVANQSSRIKGLLDGGFVSPNDAEQSESESTSQLAQLSSQRAKLLGSSLEVHDCILRAPFAGEIATRTIDPGAFVRPGSAIVSLVDRSTIRISADAPEIDFDALAPGTEVAVHVLTTKRDLTAKIARRAPAADLETRTIHIELDVPDPDQAIPVNTTAKLRLDVGQPRPALQIPLSAAAARGNQVSLFSVENGVAHLRVVSLEGELGGALFLEPRLPPNARVVTEGRALLAEGDRVIATEERSAGEKP
jgi:membrane fusion protein (multidrug efflux system)